MSFIVCLEIFSEFARPAKSWRFTVVDSSVKMQNKKK
jgi:hypothetical protein